MRKYLTTFTGVSCVGISAAVLVLLASAAVSRAGIVVVNNTGVTPVTVPGPNGGYYAQEFVANNSGEVDNLSLVLYSGTTAMGSKLSVWIASDTGSGPGSSANWTSLGLTPSLSVSKGYKTYTLDVSAYDFTIKTGNSYDIIIDVNISGPPITGWESTGSTTTTGFGNTYWGGTSGSSWNTTSGNLKGQFEMGVEVVPEVPMTGMTMGLGALAIAVSHTLRRKLCVAGNV
jgi:hypothetical protein